MNLRPLNYKKEEGKKANTGARKSKWKEVKVRVGEREGVPVILVVRLHQLPAHSSSLFSISRTIISLICFPHPPFVLQVAVYKERENKSY